ncbi:MAG: hypothetical protein ACR2GY_09935 [Phycisphaerales bacterium]
MQQILDQLSHLRTRSRTLLIIRGAAVILAITMGLLLVMGALDWLVRFPAGLRLIFLIAGMAGLAWLIWTAFLPALRFAPTLTDLALRLERITPALSGRLASSVEFARDATFTENDLAQRSMNDTQTRALGIDFDDAITPTQTRRGVLMLSGVAAFVVLLLILSPATASTGLQRLLLPLGGAQWPARTAVESRMQSVTVHARGEAIPLRARGVKAPRGKVDDMTITAHYRLSGEGINSDWRELVLASQGGGEYESLVDTNAEEIEFYFASDDDRTDRQSIALEPPPAVASATLEAAPPAYASGLVPDKTIALGPGLDERAITPVPLLAGSTAQLTLQFNKLLPKPNDNVEDVNAWLTETLGWDAASTTSVEATWPSPDQLRLRFTLAETLTLSLHLTDENGLHNNQDIAYRIDVAEDREPGVTILKPESDQSVLRTAVVPLTADARDDVAVIAVALVATRGLEGSAQQPELLWTHNQTMLSTTATVETTLELETLDVKEGDVIEVRAFAEDNYRSDDGTMHDPAMSPARRLRIISERDFGESLFQELKALRENAIRLEARQGELQDDVIDDGVQPGIGRAQERIGERLGEQIEGIQRLIDRAQMNQFEDNQLDALIDQADDLLRHAGDASNRAVAEIAARQQQSQSQPNSDAQGNAQSDPQQQPGADAQEQQPQDDPSNPEAGDPRAPGANPADQAQQPDDDQPNADQPDDPATDDEAADPLDDLEVRTANEEDRPIVDAQQEVRDELRDLIESLDRNEDTWVMNQRIKDLLDAQTDVQAQTQQLAGQTTGRPLSELEQAELSELDRIRQRQEELADQLRELIDDLRDRADAMEEVDPQSAQAQRQAADTAEQSQTDRTMEDAAQAAANNQLQNAQRNQQQARQDLERMQESLDRKRAQAQELQRRLESLIESIKQLVRVQEAEVDALLRAHEAGNYTGRDQAMIRLSQNTQAVSTDARAAGQEAARIARALDRAADAQGEAIGFIRQNPVAADQADAAEARSLEMLKEALALAEELEQQVQEDLVQQQREELVQAYRDLAERELALRAKSQALQEQGELDRRALVEARQLGNEQEDIRTAMADIAARTSEVAESIVFSHVHEMVDEWSLDVSERLREGDVQVATTDRQRSIAASLSRLAQALEQEMQEPDPFEEGNQESNDGGGGGNGQDQQQPLVPPIAELRLLRGLQEGVYEDTRDVDDRSDLDDAARRQRLRELGRQQNDLLDLGQQMLEALQEQMGQGPGGGGGGENLRDQQQPDGNGEQQPQE